MPSQLGAVQGAAPERAGTAAGLANASNQLGAAPGTAGIAAITAALGWRAGFVTAALLVVAVLGLALVPRRATVTIPAPQPSPQRSRP